MATTAAKKKETPKVKYRFRVLSGQHIQTDIVGKDENGSPIYREQKYLRGAIVESDVNLYERWPEKFAPLNEQVIIASDTDPREGETRQQYVERMQALIAAKADGLTAQVDSTPKTIDQMSNDELLAYANDNEIDLKGAKTREAVLKIVKASR